MAFDIRLHPNAVKFLKWLDEDTRNRIKLALRSLEDDPFKNRSKEGKLMERCIARIISRIHAGKEFLHIPRNLSLPMV